MSDFDVDVAIIGCGPVGMFMATFLAKAGHSVGLIERHRDLYGLPRAGHIDHEVMRFMQSVDIVDAVLADSQPVLEYVLRDRSGEVLLTLNWWGISRSGYNSDYLQFQPIFEKALADVIARSSRVVELTGWEATDLVDKGDWVHVALQAVVKVPGDPRPVLTGDRKTLRCKFLVGADGANSLTRRKFGIERTDYAFQHEQWLVVDARMLEDVRFDYDCYQVCDPEAPRTVLPLGKRHRRWEWAKLPSETVEELEKPETAWKRLAEFGVHEGNAQIIRQLVYNFEAKVADKWRCGRVLLVGDAGHTMPPFMGQGMCSGIRDAGNLAWKLDLVLRGLAADRLLDSYEEERRPHTVDWTLISIEVGRLTGMTDPIEAAERDRQLKSGVVPPMPTSPVLGSGILQRSAKRHRLVGDLSLQGRVEREGTVDLFDNFYDPSGFATISVAGDPRASLNPEQRSLLAQLRASFAYIGESASDADAFDVDGTYRKFFDAHGIVALIQRPDFYVFGVVDNMSQLSHLVDDLITQIKSAEKTLRRRGVRAVS